MTLIDRILHSILNKLFKHRDIIIDDELYMRRWYLKGLGTDSQWFLHNIRLPDKGRDLHDHPWPFATRILKGGYREQILAPNGHEYYVDRRIGDRLVNTARHTHRIDAVFGSTWTLVCAGKAERTWGFVEGMSHWRDWRSYLGLSPDHPDHPEDVVSGD